MIGERLRDSGRRRMTAFLLFLSLYAVMLFAFRVLYTGTLGYIFLNWNLFLAFLPWLLTSLANLRNIRSRVAVLFVMALWLLFFPNCLYILTDLIHLRRAENAPLWLDFIMVLTFAWAGLCYGFISLIDIERFLRESFGTGPRLTSVLEVLMIYLAAFGIYVGRFLRWNSWDLVGSPAELVTDVYGRFTSGSTAIRIIGFTVLMGTLLNAMYFPLRYLGHRSVGLPSDS